MISREDKKRLEKAKKEWEKRVENHPFKKQHKE